jgi:protein SCO1
VQSVAPAQKQIEISHEEIPGFMPAMTMSFDVADPKLLDGVAPGARVAFTLRHGPRLLRIESLRLLTPAPAGAAAAPLPLDEASVAPEFALTDQDGRPAKLSDWRGRAVLLDFVFTRCPGPCPIQTARLVELQKTLPRALAERTHFASITLDPDFDSPARMRAYAERHGADLARWSFLTSDSPTVQSVLDGYRIGTVRKPDGSLDHAVATFLIGPDGTIARRYLGLEGRASTILDDLGQLFRANSSG